MALQAAEASRYHVALVLIAATGLRRGEALALAWDRVDLDAGLLRITATLSRVSRRLVISEPKTARSRRTIPLSSAVVAMLASRNGQGAAPILPVHGHACTSARRLEATSGYHLSASDH